MEITELCLAPRRKYAVENSSSSESENNFSGRKRKFFNETPPPIQTSVDLHVTDPLPLDWEQCLDLQSGRMYYMNRKTLRKSWNWPNKNQKLDLELNISVPISEYHHHHHHQQVGDQESNEKKVVTASASPSLASSSSNMVALACLNCHLLVILSTSSPSCPNCKYVHSLPLITHQPPLPKLSPPKSLDTLSLLN